MKKNLLRLLSIVFIISILTLSFLFYKTEWIKNYTLINKEKKSQNTKILDEKITKILNIWHDLSYANFKWIELIQYIWSTTSEEKNYNFSQNILSNISKFSPYFDKIYEWWLIILPVPTNSDPKYTEEQKKILQPSLQLAYKWMDVLCDKEKINKILTSKLDNSLWNNPQLQQPCKNWMIPYLIAFYGWQLWWDKSIAKKYYTIASMQSDVPEVSKILAIINQSQEKDDYKNTALNFTLISLWWYDQEPYKCLELANKNFEFLQSKLTTNQIKFLINKEKDLVKPNEKEHQWKQTCYDMLKRWIKYTYLDFINENWKDIENLDQLLQKLWLEKVPATKEQENITLCRRTNHWDFCSK